MEINRKRSQDESGDLELKNKLKIEKRVINASQHKRQISERLHSIHEANKEKFEIVERLTEEKLIKNIENSVLQNQRS